MIAAMQADTYRLFIAAELPEQVRHLLTEAQQTLRRGNPPVIWVAPAALHLTLRFLGETPIDRTPELEQALRAALVTRSALDLTLTTIGAFPHDRQPSVIWAGIGGATSALAAMYASIEQALTALGFPADQRRFHPHVTLGRVQRNASQRQREALGATLRRQTALEASWRMERIVLFRSELRPEGPRYTSLSSAELGRASYSSDQGMLDDGG